MSIVQFHLDGLGDPIHAKGITADLKDRLGVVARCDPAGQWLEVDAPDGEARRGDVEAVVRRWGFVARSDVPTRAALRLVLRREWMRWLVTALVLGLPMLVLHYAAPWPVDLVHGIEVVLVPGIVLAAGWPIVRQGLLAARMIRATPDLLTLLIVVSSFCAGVAQWLHGESATLLHVPIMAIICAAAQRMLIHRNIDKLDGCGSAMMPTARFISLLILIAIILAVTVNLNAAFAVALCFPPMMAHLSINRISPGAMAILPVVGFATVILVLPGIVGEQLAAVRIEAAVLFQLLLTVVYGARLGLDG
ncbi:MAG: hypothetical protein KAS72_15075 [Phycisphaerales bacterium]|nr:hypothetical protein [Phycisphaerales bacterium]